MQDFIRQIGDRTAKMKAGFSRRNGYEFQEMRRTLSVDSTATAAGERPKRSNCFALISCYSDIFGQYDGYH